MWDLIISVPDHCLSFYLGDILFLPRLSVCHKIVSLSQNRVRSVTQKPFEIFS